MMEYCDEWDETGRLLRGVGYVIEDDSDQEEWDYFLEDLDDGWEEGMFQGFCDDENPQEENGYLNEDGVFVFYYPDI
jgi:hypothetical protein